MLHHAGSLVELERVLDRLPDGDAPVTLDLIGHSTRGHRLLRLGATPIDMLDPHVAGFFERLGRRETLDRLNVVALRLLGCETAVIAAGLRTLRMLSWALDLPVFGTSKPLLKSHQGPAGFDPAFNNLLVEAADPS